MDREILSQLNPYETEFLYHEIFEKNVYLRNGIQLGENAVVLDVGANIGLFALFVKQICSTARIYAFEPVADAYRCLVRNCEAFRDSVYPKSIALSNRNGSAQLIYYPGYSVISGLYGNREIDSQVIETGMRSVDSESTDARIREIVSSRFTTLHRLTVATETISKVVRDHSLEKIDLLKIDAERSEVPILAGIEEKHWRKIEQIVLEYHSARSRRTIERLLDERGFSVITADDGGLSTCGIGTIYAVRPGR